MLTAELTLKSEDGDKTFELRDNHPLFVGRTVECDVCLSSPAVSRRHAVFLTRDGDCGVKDLQSSNGTYLNGTRIVKPMRLKDGDIIQIAGFVIKFRIPKAAAHVYSEADKTTILPGEHGGVLRGMGNDTPPDVSLDVKIADGPRPPDGAPAAAAKDRAADGKPEFIPPSRSKGATTSISKRDGRLAAAAETPPTPLPAKESAGSGAGDAPDVEQLKKTSGRRPKLEIADDEIGDGADDDAFMEEAGPESEETDPELALAKAAAEAGLVGEFAPDVPEAGAGEMPVEMEPHHHSAAISSLAAEQLLPYEPDAFAIPVDGAFREAIETRLFLYSYLSDLKGERDAMLAAAPDLPEAVKSELARQDREMDKLPSAEKAEEMIEKRLARREELKRKIKEARETGLEPPPRPSREMREAEELAINQWTMIAQSDREALPAAYREGYRLSGNEPLAGALSGAGIDGLTLMGGGAYLLALGVLQDEAKYNRALIKAKLAITPPPDGKKSGGGGGRMFRGLLSKVRGDEDAEEEGGAEEEGANYEELAEAERNLGSRVGWINQELAYIEALLIKEFWNVYVQAALRFLPEQEKMPLPVRAFLRYGAIGFMPWWMKDEVCTHIMDDLASQVELRMRVSRDKTNVLYADEYLAAVMNMECTPALDENLEINERNSPNWKADKALRKLINAQAQSARMRELLETLDGRIEEKEQQAAKLEERLAALLTGSKNYKQTKSELSHQRQAFRVEVAKLNNLAAKIKDQTLAMLQEAIDETRARFESGELPQPSREFLVRRECEAVRKIGRLLANLKERFLPLVLKENFILGLDAVNDRPSILGEILDMERRDPAIFLENVIPSKKKANRVDIRVSPVVVLVPSAGILAFSWNPRQRPEDGRLGIPTCFIRPRLRERQLTYLLSDFRWDTAKAAAGMDIMNSDTIVAAFMSVRWDWRKRSKEGREKGLIYNEQNDRTNWRRVYESYMQTAYDSGKKLYNRNYDFYERIIGKYFDLPEGVTLLKK